MHASSDVAESGSLDQTLTRYERLVVVYLDE